VRIREQGGEVALVTADISSSGVFVVTDSPRNDRELLQLSFELADGAVINVMGVVSHRLSKKEVKSSGQPGMGISFFARPKELEQRWDALVARVADGSTTGPAHPMLSPLPTRREQPRFLCRFLLRLKDTGRLRDFYSKDISAGGTFVRTPAPRQVSGDVELVLVHPQPPHHEFPLGGRVVHVVDGPTLADRGVGIQFARLRHPEEASLVTFIETGVNYLRNSDDAQLDRVQLLRQASEQAGDSPATLAALGHALIQETADAEARALLERALRLDPGCALARDGLLMLELGVAELPAQEPEPEQLAPGARKK
jgi:Tfp pilus assembly protein PilZ